MKWKETWLQIADCKEFHIIEKNQIRIGFIGLGEHEWLKQIDRFEITEVEYEDFIHCANRLIPLLQNEHSCEFIVAITHMRDPNDIRLAEEAKGLDLILGGHDHTTVEYKINGVLIKKSGTDFREFSKIEVEKRQWNDSDFCYNENSGVAINFETVKITSKIEPDEELVELVKYFTNEMAVKQLSKT